jgi:hypothetical protein
MPFFRMRKIKSHRKAAKNAREYFLYLLRLEKEYTEVTEKDRNTETFLSSKTRMDNNGNPAFPVFSAFFGGSVYRNLKPG